MMQIVLACVTIFVQTWIKGLISAQIIEGNEDGNEWMYMGSYVNDWEWIRMDQSGWEGMGVAGSGWERSLV